MSLKTIIKGRGIHLIIADILNRIHINGPVSIQDFETLAYVKKFHPDVFDKYESKLISLMGLFYKAKESKSFLEEVYSIFSAGIEESLGKKFTPVQADAFSRILKRTFFSFSAPTSAGKSFLFRELIQGNVGDMVIVVPSRALISEYISIVTETVDKSVLVLQFIDVVNSKNTKRRIFIITPERGIELFKSLDKLDVTLILFDEAQISEDGIRGMRFDSFVRRVNSLLPNAKKVFTHPFIENPEAQLNKHNINFDSDYKSYKQNSVGKIFLSHKDGKFRYFSPFEDKKNKTKIKCLDDVVRDKINENCTVLIYISKGAIYNGSFISKFSGYIDLCPPLTDPDALKYIDKLKEFIGASSGDSDDDKRSLLIDLMKRGVVIHHGSIPLKARLLIEEFVKKDFARICFSTATLIQGVNMPFDVVWINNFNFKGTEDQKNLDLKNLIGRAGRSTNRNSQFDYGYVIVEDKNVRLFSERLMASPSLSNKSKIDEESEGLDEDQRDIVEAIKGSTFNNELLLTNSQVERIENADIDGDIAFIIENLLVDGRPLTATEYYQKGKKDQLKIKEAFKKIFVSHLRRKELTTAESSVLSASIPILLWQIQGKSFSEIISLRHAFLSKKDDKRHLIKLLKFGEINIIEYGREMEKLLIRYSAAAASIPDKSLRKHGLYPLNTPISKLEYDTIVYDTYDYIDKVISFSLKDPLCAAFTLYYQKTNDVRAKIIDNYIKYGTNDATEIWLIRYGFSFDDIEWIIKYVESVDEREIVFKDTVKDLDADKFKVINRFVNN